jgi:hypothetical protein
LIQKLRVNTAEQTGEQLAKEVNSKTTAEVTSEAAQKTGGRLTGWLSSLASAGGGRLLALLRSDGAAEMIAGGIRAAGSEWSAFKLIEDKVTKENIQKLLNPECLKGLSREVSEHQLYSPGAIKTYLGQNTESIAGQIAEWTGFSPKTVQSTLETLLKGAPETAVH